MRKLRQMYEDVDEEIRKMSRTSYAALIGVTTGAGSLVAGSALGEPDLTFTITIGIGMTLLYYALNPNQ